MKYLVHLLAFSNGKLREVELPHEVEPSLEQIYKYGQNDFQPQQLPSVSVGDVVQFENKLFVALPVGFKEVTIEEFNECVEVPQRERSFYWYKKFAEENF
jgi:hypothetical protein